ncbi:hypothetical protein, partial [Vibrio sp.]|uniref:hypothetical protein n=1 Tax=Vibrio sp. TaxID=678 RepID=UPI0037B4F547
ISHAVYLSVNRSGENTSTDYTATPSSFHTPEIIIARKKADLHVIQLGYSVSFLKVCFQQGCAVAT